MAGLNKSSDTVYSWERFDKRIERDTQIRSLSLAEKGYTSELNTRGRKSFFEECFDGISLNEQNLPVVGPFEDITLTKSFQNGRERGEFLVKNGFTLEQYRAFLLEFENKYSQENNKKHR